MAKANKSFVETYELKATAIIIVLASVLSYGWWQLIMSGMLDAAPWHTRLAPVLIAAVILFIVQSGRFNRKQQANYLRVLTHTSALAVLFMIFWDWWHWVHLTRGITQWASERTFFTGQAAILFLMLSLAVTPLVTLFGWSSLNAVKKSTGNYGFMFALVHLGLFVIEQSLVGDELLLGLAVENAILKRYALVGLVAFALLVPLAVTSNKWSQKRLGKNWKQLHKLVYLVNILGVTHYIWVWMSKRALERPIAYAIIVAFLLLIRVDWVKKRIRNYKRSRRVAKRAAA